LELSGRLKESLKLHLKKQREDVSKFYIHRYHGKIKFHASITTISYSFEARGLKFGMKIYLINAVKLVGQIFKFLYGSRDN